MTTEVSPLIISGPSGVGKGTLIDKLMSEYPNTFAVSVSHTSRSPRHNEIDGIHYHFTSKDNILKMVENDEFVEHATVHGNVYGTSVGSVQSVLDNGRICILEIDVQGAQQLHDRSTFKNAKYLFLDPPSSQELERRLRKRGTETEDKILERLRNADDECEAARRSKCFETFILSDFIDSSFERLVAQLSHWFGDTMNNIAG
eukprot:GHVR01020172.1.p1 GENE.GHVR01020172.1~~GHVR01020172.1.p1  ORF type:complete len:202 (-),score=34.62 GHVR01020172.1:40-645(-)